MHFFIAVAQFVGGLLRFRRFAAFRNSHQLSAPQRLPDERREGENWQTKVLIQALSALNFSSPQSPNSQRLRQLKKALFGEVRRPRCRENSLICRQ